MTVALLEPDESSPAVGALSSVDDSIVPSDQLVARRAEDSTLCKQPGYFDSALDEAEYSVDPPSLSIGAERIRRRSVLERQKAFETLPPSLRALEVIELPELSRVSEYPGTTSIPSTVRITITEVDSSRRTVEEDLEVASQTPVSEASTAAADGISSAPLLSVSQKVEFIWRSRLHLAALYWCLFLEGWNDGSTGPMLPTIQRYYNVGFAIVSLLFVVNCIGFISGAVIGVYLNDRFGFGKVLVIGAIIQLLGYVILGTGGPFPFMCIAFGMIGFALSLQNAQANGFVGCLKEHATIKMSFLHASYGLGAFVAPLVATQFATQHHWYFHYLVSVGIGSSNAAILYLVFRFRNQDEILAREGQAAGEADTASQSKYRQILSLRVIHFLSAFALIYVGVEVTLGGWIVTFIQQKRGGGASAGYISAGFFGGLMLGRMCLMWLNRKIGPRNVMFLYAFLAILLEVTIWAVPSLFENAVAISFIGLLLGPMYPILMNYCGDVLPKWLLTGGVGWIAGVGQAGSAVLPFITGLLASKFGIGSLQPFIVSMMSTMIVVWAFVPRARHVD